MEEKDLQKYDWVEQYPPRYSRVFRDLFLAYFLIAFLLAMNILLSQMGLPYGLTISVMILSGMLNAIFMHTLFLFLHESSHYNLLPNREQNDTWANFLVGYWFFHDVRMYRRMHWNHHVQHGKLDDPENSYFSPMNLRNMLLSLGGIYIVLKILDWDKHTQTETNDEKDRPRKWTAILFFIIYQMLIAWPFIKYEAYLPYLIVWALPLFLGFPFCGFVRQVCEHRKPGAGNREYNNEPHGCFSRVFKDTLFAYFFGAAGFRLHWYHHFNPHISYTRLDDFANEVKKTVPDLPPEEIKPVSYLKTFMRLFRESAEEEIITPLQPGT